ncbi:autotransporter assembly complex protein TamA [Rhizobium rhizosphaerae]
MSRLSVSTRLKTMGLCLAAAGLALAGPLSVGEAHAFKLFGINFFGKSDEEQAAAEISDPVPYAVTIDAPGADEDLTEALQNASQLYQEREQPASGDLGLVIRARDDRERLLAALYEQARYGGVVDMTIDGQSIDSLPPIPDFPRGQPIPVVVHVTPGPVFSVGKVHLTGDIAGSDPAAYDLAPGRRADSTVILKAGRQAVDDLKQTAHPFAKMTERQAVADHSNDTVDVTLGAESGPQATFGAVGVTGTKRMNPEFVARYSRLDTRKPYSPEELRKAQERLRALGVFSSISVKEGTALDSLGGLPLTIEVSEGKQRYFGVGANYSSADGFGAQAYWGHRNLFGEAESLRIEGEVSRLGIKDVTDFDYSAGITYVEPGAFGPPTSFTASLKAAALDPEGYTAKTVTGLGMASYELNDTDTVSAGVEVAWATIEDAFGNRDYLTPSLPIEFIRDARDDKLNPKSGYRASLAIKPSYEIYGQTPFVSTEGSITGYRGFGTKESTVLAARLAAGIVGGGDDTLDDIPATRRFFLGGGGTVRGYAYQEISPVNAKGDELGGRSYVNINLEARIGVTETISVVPFIDAATVSAKAVPDFNDIRAGAGIGVRYNTGFGPIRVDVALPLNPYPGGTRYGIYAGIGQTF